MDIPEQTPEGRHVNWQQPQRSASSTVWTIKNRPDKINMILSLLDNAKAQNIAIEIEWIPPGNETADVTAKPGMNFGTIDNTLYPILNHIIMNKWLDLWDLHTHTHTHTQKKKKKKKKKNTGKAYRIIQPTVKKTATQFSSIRQHDIVNTRASKTRSQKT